MATAGATLAEQSRVSIPKVAFASEPGGLVMRVSGAWLIELGPPGLAAVGDRLRATPAGTRLRLEADRLDEWDSLLPSFLLRVQKMAAAQGLAIDPSGLPDGAVRLVRLAAAVPEHGGRGPDPRPALVERVGAAFAALATQAADATTFLGEATVALGRLLRGRALMRGRDFWFAVQQAGVDALPIIGVISFLVGMIQAFVGGSQLALFGAQLFVANLVAIAMLREMGPLMAALIMAGRTGSAYAAELGTMQVNEEIDALRGLGISPVEFLVLPRLLAMALMMPLLAVYANLFGVIGGAMVGVGVLGITPITYWQQSLEFLRPQDMVVGLVKAAVFGILVGAAGCWRGIRSGRDAAAVGASTTSAVVTGIVVVIVADFVINVVCFALGV